MTRLRIASLALGLCLAAGAARAQTVYLGRFPGDSTMGLVPGAEVQVPVRATNPSGTYYYVNQAKITVHFDPSAVQIAGLVADGLNSIVDSSRTAGTFSFLATGCASGTDAGLVRLRATLQPSATSGTRLYVTTDSTQLWEYCYSYYGLPINTAFASAPGSVCAASTLYGDVDGNDAVDSRDALITLSAAVGLPVTGFNLALGDVDGDGLVNSRDALIMLSYSIGLSTGTNQIGFGPPTGCPGLTAPTERIVLRTHSAVYGNDSLALLDAGSTTPVLIPNSMPFPFEPRLAADGASVVYQCAPPYPGYPQVCRVQTDGSGSAQDTLPNSSQVPDWSPDGSLIAFRLNGQPATMDSAGGNVLGTPFLAANGSVVFSRDGSKMAYVYYDGTIFTVNVDSGFTGAAQVPVAVNDAALIRWSPAGDSLAFTRTGEPGIWVVAAAGGTPVQRTTFRVTGQLSGEELGFDWSTSGIVFASEEPGSSGLWLLPSSGAVLQRLTSGPHLEPSFRRNP